MQRTADNVKRLADQTKESKVFMNWYHKFLFQQLETGNIDEARFLRETHAIMVELRYTNLKHLEEVLKSQNKESASQIMEELDFTLLALMPHLKNKDELNSHIQNLRDAYKPVQKVWGRNI